MLVAFPIPTAIGNGVLLEQDQLLFHGAHLLHRSIYNYTAFSQDVKKKTPPGTGGVYVLRGLHEQSLHENGVGFIGDVEIGIRTTGITILSKDI